MTTLRLRIGTRASNLARWQANWVATQLTAGGVQVELVPITTRGDAVERGRIEELGGPGVFTKELQRAVLDGQVDLAVHSLKDLPTEQVEGLILAAVAEREDVRDVLISRGGEPLDQLPQQAVIGTGSLRRRAQLLCVRSDLEMRDIRGNVDTRLQKLAAGPYDAIVLAYAGLKRLGLDDQITQVLQPDMLLPAVGQGALAIEARVDDRATRAALARLDHASTHRSVLAERTLLAALCGGCMAPVGAWARELAAGQLRLDAVVLSPDGRQRIAAWSSTSDGDAPRLGSEVANQLLAQGAAELIERSRQAP
jgi:hydroxymethylbilane synthase